MLRFPKVQGREKLVEKRKLKRQLHKRVVLEASRSGLTKEQAAARAGMKLAGVNTLLKEEFGTQSWPIVEEE